MKTPYLVFFGRRGERSIVWRPEENPCGVFLGDTPDEACQAASTYLGVMGSFFAVEGHFWGVLPGQVPQPFGTASSTDDKLGKLIEKVSNLLPALEAGNAGEIEGEADEA